MKRLPDVADLSLREKALLHSGHTHAVQLTNDTEVYMELGELMAEIIDGHDGECGKRPPLPDWLCDDWGASDTWFAYFLEEFQKAASTKQQTQLLECLRRLFV